MPAVRLRPVTADDFTEVLALNTPVQHLTSVLDLDRLRQLHGWSDYHKVALLDGQAIGFLLAMRDGSGYDSSNYHWFAAHYPRFQYVDRIVVAPAAAGNGVGKALYQDLIAHARACQQPLLTCEYNIAPPNPASAAFHDRFGFREVGRRDLGEGKMVSMQVLALAAQQH